MGRLAMADREMRRLHLTVGDELRLARLNGGLRQKDVARSLGISIAMVSRAERGMAPGLALGRLVRHAAAVGLVVRVSLFPAGAPVRDAAQLALLTGFRRRISPQWSWRVEVPMPIAGDLRALDAVAEIPGCRVAIDAYTRLADVQAQVRSSLLKARDAGTSRLVILVRDTHANRRALAAAAGAIEGSFPLGTRSVLAAMANGRDPGNDALVVLSGAGLGQPRSPPAGSAPGEPNGP